MKVGPKSSLRPFLHRALQLHAYCRHCTGALKGMGGEGLTSGLKCLYVGGGGEKHFLSNSL